MQVTIHQPEHMPWLGFFHKMAQADLFVILDNVQFTKNNWQNRNKFIDPNGRVFWLTVPVLTKGHLKTTIKDMEIDYTQKWQKKYWGRLSDSYRHHPYFEKYAADIKTILDRNYQYLVEINYQLLHFFRKALGINNRIVKASELNPTGKRSELLLDICLKTGATSYLSGPSGRDYLTLQIFSERDIEVRFHQFNHPVYESKHFSPYLSTLDFLMNHGGNNTEIIKNQQTLS